MGLAGAAIQSGARSALASVWQVDDASTAQLMQDFYAAYRGGESKSGALRSAQLALSRDPEFANPYYWAAFTIIGGWR
jgi:CHAT domain-containing protein